MDAIKVSSIASIRFVQLVYSNVGATKRVEKVGSLHLTPQHLIFRAEGREEIWIPHSIQHTITKSSTSTSSLTSHTSSHSLALRTRDYKTFLLEFEQFSEMEAVWDSLKGLCKGVDRSTALENLYAFYYQPSIESTDSTLSLTESEKRVKYWNLYDPMKEFTRMGVGSRTNAWRITEINSNFEFSPTYPTLLCVPSKISDTTLSYAVKYRSKGRLPGLVYLHWNNLGTITRCSQPLVGLKNARSIQDEKLISSIFTSHGQHTSTIAPSSTNVSPSASVNGATQIYGSQPLNLLVDARPSTNAMANSVKGAGTENMEYYGGGSTGGCKKVYLGIGNIHVMRSSLNSIWEALASSPVSASALAKTGWISHISTLLSGAALITNTIHFSNSHVLLHCSDGWDRTSQLSSLAQICLDPFMRTAQGFAIGIAKDWEGFGHKFNERSGWGIKERATFVEENRNEEGGRDRDFLSSMRETFNGGGSSAYKETSPVFQQFLDGTWQIWRQFPKRFEFNEEFLVKLFYEFQSGRYGNFLWDCERIRGEEGAKEKTWSVWERFFDLVNAKDGEIEFRLKEEFRNELFDKSEDATTSLDMGVLAIDANDVKWWFGLFGRSDEEMNGIPIVSTVASELESDTAYQVLSVPPPPELKSKSLYNFSSSPYSSNSNLASTTSSLTSTINGPTQQPDQLGAALASAQKYGWSAWKNVKSGYQEGMKTYREQQSLSSYSPNLSPSVSSTKVNIIERERDLPTTQSSYKPYRPSSTTTLVDKAPPPPISLPLSTANPWSTESAQLSPKIDLLPPPPVSPSSTKHSTFSTSTLESFMDAEASKSKVEENYDPLGVGFN